MHTRLYLLAGALTYTGLQVSAPASALGQERQLYQMLSEYSRCVATTVPAAAKGFVLSAQKLESGNSAKVKRPMTGRCSYAFDGNEEVRFIASWYRDELAYQLVRVQFLNQGPMSFADKEQLRHPTPPVRGNLRYGYEKMEFDNSRFGECVARSAPEEVRLWLMASREVKDDDPADGGRCRRFPVKDQRARRGGQA